MSKPIFLLLVAIAAIGWFAYDRFDTKWLEGFRLVGQSHSDATSGDNASTLCIASFNIEGFGLKTLDNPLVMDILVQTIRRFDLVAIQGIRADQTTATRQFMDRVNEEGHQYHCILGPPLGRDSPKQRLAFFFDEMKIETDHSASYTVRDPDDLLARPPLVAWFRTRGAATDRAFTFTLVNVDVDQAHANDELKALDDVFFKVRDDGRGEDDVIMLGSFHVDDQHLGELGHLSGVSAVICGMPTNTQQTEPCDNLVLHQPATVEFLGRSGVFDILREHNLTLEQARLVSEHLPVWAEFSVLEQGSDAAFANAATPVERR